MRSLTPLRDVCHVLHRMNQAAYDISEISACTEKESQRESPPISEISNLKQIEGFLCPGKLQKLFDLHLKNWFICQNNHSAECFSQSQTVRFQANQTISVKFLPSGLFHIKFAHCPSRTIHLDPA